MKLLIALAAVLLLGCAPSFAAGTVSHSGGHGTTTAHSNGGGGHADDGGHAGGPYRPGPGYGPYRDRIAADGPFVQYFDGSPLGESKFDQAPLEFIRGQIGCTLGDNDAFDPAAKPVPGEPQRQIRW